MTEKMKTVCVGRYLVDVPDHAEVSMSDERINGFAIETFEEGEAEFRARVIAREAGIGGLAAGAGDDNGGGMVEARDLRIPGMIGRTFVYGRSSGYLMEGTRRVDLESVSVEVNAHIGGLSFSLSAKSTEEASAREAEALLAQLRLRGENEVPTLPGFCIWRAVFTEPLPTHKNEQVAMHLGMPGHPDFAVTLLSVAGVRPGPSLLARVARVDADASPDELLRVTKLRSDQCPINGLGGDEVIERIREFNFTTTYTLNWETRGEEKDLLLPYLSLEAQAGIGQHAGAKPAGASLHEDALLSLWDRISSTIRLRHSVSAPAINPPS